jgi:DNA ligase (NAD+)
VNPPKKGGQSDPAADIPSTSLEAQAEHARLVEEIQAHDEAYYQHDAPTVSDADYDALRKRLVAIEEKFPELVTAESPTQKVSGAASEKFAKAKHGQPMLSLDNAFDGEDVTDFVGRVRRFLNLKDEEIAFNVEPKIDGLSANLR